MNRNKPAKSEEPSKVAASKGSVETQTAKKGPDDMIDSTISQSLVRELLEYCPISGILTWRSRDHKWFKKPSDCKRWNTRFAGERAGTLHVNRKTGYRHRKTTLLGKRYLEHHVIWIYMTDEPIPPAIDHINHDATDNRWNNIRASSYLYNARNKSKRITNTSGFNGVFKNKNKWVARCGFNGKYLHLGSFSTPEQAAEAVIAFQKANGFDDGHGIDVAHYHKNGDKA